MSLFKRFRHLSKSSSGAGSNQSRFQPARRRKGPKAGLPQQPASCGCLIETLENRLLLSATAVPTFILLSRGSSPITPKRLRRRRSH